MKKYKLKQEVKDILAMILFVLTIWCAGFILAYNVDQTEQQQIVEKN